MNSPVEQIPTVTETSIGKISQLTRPFFEPKTTIVPREVLGKLLISQLHGATTIGRIVETEAYLANRDSACHASKKRTPRNEVMFREGGLAYVYSIHAKHCFNVVTELEGLGCAVLIRALEPLVGQATMRSRRGLDNERRLTTGPGCLCLALGIERSVNGLDLTESRLLWLAEDGFQWPKADLRTTPRIGVTSAKKRKLRYVVKGHPFVSGPLSWR